MSDVPEVPEADAIEQAQAVGEVVEPDRPHLGIDVPEADALEQAQPVDLDDDY
jgi:hypothetical protein